ncbi:hypothetical protein P4679_22590 [Priestia megaterium]|uniref:hypothetical protein n=1 Tax=Priestia megaterium TaxID=1404 RepID=UPI002E21A114|nr:hypothetical protein [Priestia megaterium]
MVVRLNQIDETGKREYKFKELTSKEVGGICDKLANQNVIKIRLKRFKTKK